MTSREPAVSVITSTWQRHEMLLERCIPAIQAQVLINFEHIIVSDGPDPVLREKLSRPWLTGPYWRHCQYLELPAHDPEPHWGSYARLAGLAEACGKYITYCDDDDALRPRHCSLMADALSSVAGANAGFAVSRMRNHHPTDPGKDVIVGWGPLAMGNVGTPMIMHRRETLEHGTWGEPSFTEDWDLVWKWLQAGVTYVNVDEETADVYPSFFRPDTTHGNKPGTMEKA